MNVKEALNKACRIRGGLVYQQSKIEKALVGANDDIEKLVESIESGVVTWDVLDLIKQIEEAPE